ncbi:MAG: hypothetical protein ACREFF_06830 [Candidatus Udaeobacter sp.]
MKEDILEQLVEDWLQSKGYFTRANLKFKPDRKRTDYERRKDSVASDIDVIGFHPRLSDPEAVMVVGCKSWQDGFWVRDMVEALTTKQDKLVGNKEAWKHFRELVRDKWTDAFMSEIREKTGRNRFTYVTAVTVIGDPQNRQLWHTSQRFRAALRDNPIRLVTLREMLGEVFGQLGTTVESSQFSRTLQLLKAAGISLELHDTEPAISDDA